MCGPVGRKVCGVIFGGVTWGLVVCVCVYIGAVWSRRCLKVIIVC